MSEFLEQEAEYTDREDTGSEHSDDGILRSKKRKKKIVDDEEDEETDDGGQDQTLDGFIHDSVNEEDDEEESSSKKKKRRKRKRRHSEEFLDEADLELVEENNRNNRKGKKMSRIVMDESDEEIRSEDGRDEDNRSEASMDEGSNSEDAFIDNDQESGYLKGNVSNSAFDMAREIFGGGDDEEDEENLMDDEEETSQTGNNIYDIYEPSELERAHLTDLDNSIRMTDLPERFQMRRDNPVKPASEAQLDHEALWIFNGAFNTSTLSLQSAVQNADDPRAPLAGRKSQEVVPKIKTVLSILRNEKLEVPFIAFYRKELVEPELNINDLWTIYDWDGKWCDFRRRKRNLRGLMKGIKSYRARTEGESEQESSTITREHFKLLQDAKTSEDLNDLFEYVRFHMSYDQGLRDYISERKNREQQQEEGGEDDRWSGEDNSDDDEEVDAQESESKLRRPKTFYEIGRELKLHTLVRDVGLESRLFGENLRDNYQRHEVQQCQGEALEKATGLICNRFKSAESVLEAARSMAAIELSKEPLVRKAIRKVYQERARISLKPNKDREKEMDENHPCFFYRYLKDKPISELFGDQFLQIQTAKEEGLLECQISMGTDKYLEEIKFLYTKDGFSQLIENWNSERVRILSLALEKHLLPAFERETTNRLLQESKDVILRLCRKKLYNWLKIAPYKIEAIPDESREEEGVRVMGIAYAPKSDKLHGTAYGALLDGNGEVQDVKAFPHLLKRKTSWNKTERLAKESALISIKDYIAKRQPHVIAVGGHDRDALLVLEDIKTVVNDLRDIGEVEDIKVELVENELANVFMSSKVAEEEFRDQYPLFARQSISLARRLLDPLAEFSQLCTQDEDILCLKFNPLQDKLNKTDLLQGLHLEFINRTNEVGVDVNRAVLHPHTANLLQYVSGLGPRKAGHILKCMKQIRKSLTNRTQLVQDLRIGSVVFYNCSGFIKIVEETIADGDDGQINPLDATRIHPESYDLVKKMAEDAIEEDVRDKISELLNEPSRLHDVDLDKLAEELEKNELGNKKITVYDIQDELNHGYKDFRTPFCSPSHEEVFYMLSKETPETLHFGKRMVGQVTAIVRKAPSKDKIQSVRIYRDSDSGKWECPICYSLDFANKPEAYDHLDHGHCPGKPVGVRVRMDNDLQGFIPIIHLSEKYIKNPDDDFKPGTFVDCRISSINFERFSLVLTSRLSDIEDKNNSWTLPKDKHYDSKTEQDRTTCENDKNQNKKSFYLKRIIVHPSFKNINFHEAEAILKEQPKGTVIIRPSSKGMDHLTASWKIHNDVLQHIDILEEGKEKGQYSLGKTLRIENKTYEDLDEIIATHVNPMAQLASEILAFKYFKDLPVQNQTEIENLLNADKIQVPQKIPYILTLCREYPGKFMLSYLPRKRCRHEYVGLTPDGIRYRNQTFRSLNHMIKYFKANFDATSENPQAHNGRPYTRPVDQDDPYTPGELTANTPLYVPTPLHATPQESPSQKNERWMRRMDRIAKDKNPIRNY